MENTLQNFDEYRKKHPMDVQAVIKMGSDICEELEQYRHAQVPHCDIKATNIMVTESGDFTLAKTDENVHTEQTADLYALGLLMYRLLNKGRMPFMPVYPKKATPQDKQNAIQRCVAGEPFPDPLMGGRAIGDVLRRACHVQPEERYLTAGELKAALEKAAEEIQALKALQELEVEERNDTKSQTGEEQQEILPKKPEVREEAVEYAAPPKVKESKKRTKHSSKGRMKLEMPHIQTGLLKLWVTLSALSAAVFLILVTTGVMTGMTGIKGYIYCGVQVILCGLCASAEPDHPGLKPAVKRTLLKFLWILATLDSLFVILYSLVLKSLLERYEIGLASFYVPGLLSMLAPILAGIIYWVWSVSSDRVAYHKLRICTMLMAVIGIVITVFGITGFNKSIALVELHPYWLGGAQLILALLCIVNAKGRLVIRMLCILSFLFDIALLLVPFIQEKFSSFGLPEWVLGKGFGVLTFLIPLAAWLLLVRSERHVDKEKKSRKS